jgi:hypothetical protein
MFFFGSYQRTNRSKSEGSIVTLPTAAMRQGIVPGMVQLPFLPPFGIGFLPYDPVTDTTNIAPFLSPVNQKLLELIPVPTTEDGSYQNYTPTKDSENQYLVRLDYLWGAHRMYMRYFGATTSSPALGDPTVNILSVSGKSNYKWQNTAFGDSWSRGNLVNEFRFSYLYSTQNGVSLENSPSYASLGSTVTPPSTPAIFVLSTFMTDTPSDGSTPRRNFDISDNVSLIKGAHTLSFGFEGQRIHLKMVSNSGQAPLMIYAGLWGTTGDSRIDFMLGNPTIMIESDGQFSSLTGNLIGFHGEDVWRVARRTTVTLGMRWDPYYPFHSDNNALNCYATGKQSTVYTNAPAGLLFPGDAGCNSAGTGNTIGNVQPRIGIAHQLDESGNTSLRAGYGIYTMQVPLSALQAFNNALPFLRTYIQFMPMGLFSGGGTVDNPWGPGQNPFVNGYYTPGQIPPGDVTFPSQPSITSLDPSFQNPYVHQYTLSIQRTITNNDMVEVAYAGTTGRHLMLNYNLNWPVYNPNLSLDGNKATYNQRRPDQNFENVYQIRTDGNSRYNGLNVTYRHTSKAFFVTSSLNLGQAKDDGSIPGSTLPGAAMVEPTLQHDFRYAPSDFDQKMQWRTNLVWNTPKVETWSQFAKLALGDWSVSLIANVESGMPFSVSCNQDNSATNGASELADLVQGASTSVSDQSAGQWFNTDAFTCNAPGTFGNSGRNSLRGPGYVNFDMGFAKAFPIKESVKLAFRADAFNVFNHTNLGSPASGITSPNFGEINFARDPRTMQLSLRLDF